MIKLEENIDYMGWSNCLRLANNEMEIIIASAIGPRILGVGFIDKQNLFYLSPDEKGKTGGKAWRIYGGHRLWLAPEVMPATYAPDNEPVTYRYKYQTLTITGQKEDATGVVKELEISMSPDRNQVAVLHRLQNQNTSDVKLSPWALSVLAPGGRAIIPQEPYGEGNDYLLPARTIALWPYTRMQDPRWVWGDKYIWARQDPSISSEQKIGILNKQGWAAYCLNDETFIKLFTFDASAAYPDYGSNNEIYINGNFLELETLGPLLNIRPGGITEHREYWFLDKEKISTSEASVDLVLLPKVLSFRKQIEAIHDKRPS